MDHLKDMTIEERVIHKIEQRAMSGKAKYGTTMEGTDLTHLQWFKHAQEEALDLAIYLEKLIAIRNELDEAHKD